MEPKNGNIFKQKVLDLRNVILWYINLYLLNISIIWKIKPILLVSGSHYKKRHFQNMFQIFLQKKTHEITVYSY